MPKGQIQHSKDSAQGELANCIWIHQKTNWRNTESENERQRLKEIGVAVSEDSKREMRGRWTVTVYCSSEWKDWEHWGAKANGREREVRGGELKKEKRWKRTQERWCEAKRLCVDVHLSSMSMWCCAWDWGMEKVEVRRGAGDVSVGND